MKRVLVYTVLIVMAVLMVVPMLWTLTTSLSQDTTTVKLHFLPHKVTLQNYVDAWFYPDRIQKGITMGRFFFNSVVMCVFITVLSIFSDSMAGYVLARKRFPFREQVFFLALATMMIPFYVTSIPMFLFVRDFGWINSFMGLIVPFIGSGFGVYMFRQAFLAVPVQIEEAARLDGLSDLGIYLRIMLALVKPTIATMVIFKAMWSWNIFYWPLLVVNSMDMYTLPLGLTLFRGLNVTRWGLLTAGLMIAVMPIIILFLAMQRQFIRGLTAGAVKE